MFSDTTSYFLCPKIISPEKFEYPKFFDFKEKINEFLYWYDDFVFCFNKVVGKPVEFFSSPYQNKREIELESFNNLKVKLRPVLEPFHRFQIKKRIVFPKRKNVIYDSGKLNKMIKLLRDLRMQGHKCLIFTQVIFNSFP